MYMKRQGGKVAKASRQYRCHVPNISNLAEEIARRKASFLPLSCPKIKPTASLVTECINFLQLPPQRMSHQVEPRGYPEGISFT
ncbi:hypothetical protein RRG08_062035 [Elysia crispata]|uniref:Uncharacterized protein n=1 Tax=Elysia crispata TaxID=231223 RepID=A0AAE1A301_9GAST|nr:hypothetical protein RRG08_062035 [Elysia crispata]